MSLRTIAALPFVLAVLRVATPVLAQPLGTAFSYQGELRFAGAPASEPHDMRFRLYGAVLGGAQVGSMLCVDNVPLSDGRFTVSLDFGAVFMGQSRYLEIDVRADTGLDCSNGAGFTVLTPRQPVTPAPYALFATNAAAAATALTAANATQLNGQAASFYQNANNLTNGTVASARLPIPLSLGGAVDFSAVIVGANGSATGYGLFGYSVSASGETCGVGGESSSTDGTGVLGIASAASGNTHGVQGVSYSPAGRAVLGVSNATSGYTVGVQGESSQSNPTGTGVVGKAQATGGWFEANGSGGTGLFGVATGTSTLNTGVDGRSYGYSGTGVRGTAYADQGYTFGVSGTSHSGFGTGVKGIATSTSGWGVGVDGETASPGGSGVSGYANSASGNSRGVWGRSDSTTGVGVQGSAAASSGDAVGVLGESSSSTGIGVQGLAEASTGSTHGVYGRSESPNGHGVTGWATSSSGTTYGVLGESDSASGWGVFAWGRLGASGTKSFRIDHPADPENKYLLHYSAESPEVINFYRGTVALDSMGEALVELPGYFAAINRDPSYTLTAIGAAMPLLHISEEIDGESLRLGGLARPGETLPPCSFRIAGGAPGAKVSWRVEAVRNDHWVRDQGAPAELEKQAPERGKYQHPEHFGLDSARGLHDVRKCMPSPAPSESSKHD